VQARLLRSALRALRIWLDLCAWNHLALLRARAAHWVSDELVLAVVLVLIVLFYAGCLAATAPTHCIWLHSPPARYLRAIHLLCAQLCSCRLSACTCHTTATLTNDLVVADFTTPDHSPATLADSILHTAFTLLSVISGHALSSSAAVRHPSTMDSSTAVRRLSTVSLSTAARHLSTMSLSTPVRHLSTMDSSTPVRRLSTMYSSTAVYRLSTVSLPTPVRHLSTMNSSAAVRHPSTLNPSAASTVRHLSTLNPSTATHLQLPAISRH
jgi:hypothetical protein